MSIESIVAAIALAIEKEEQAEAFYGDWADRIQDPGSASMLRELAAQEAGHKQRLEAGLAIAEGVEPGAVPEGIASADALVEPDLTPQSTTQDVLIVAVKREERAEQMYAELAKWAPPGDLRDLLAGLAGEEATHQARLRDLYDTLVLTDD